MGIGLTEEHEALAESVRRFVERHVRPRDMSDGAALWSALTRQGLPGIHLPEELGGQGYGLPELAVALEELGRACAPGPFLPTVLASALAPDATGAGTGAVVLTRGLTGSRSGAAFVASGRVEPVLGAVEADVIVAPVDVDGDEVWVVLDPAGLTVTPSGSLDLTRGVAAVEADRTAVRVVEGLTPDAARAVAAVLLGAEACGVADRALEIATEYAKVREQFGRPIGQFQGVKHKCALMLVALERARAAVWDAARAVAANPGSEEAALAASVAAVLAPDAAVRCAADAIQVLGGIGYTYEHDAHLYYRRALTLRALLGDAGIWAERVARLASAGVRRPLDLDLPPDAQAARKEIRERLAEIARLEPLDRVARMAEDGWTMPHLPRPWGRDASPLEQVLVHQEMAAADLPRPNLAIGAWVVPSLVAYGSREQRERFIPPTLRGEILWCQLFSEPGAGSDLASLSTRAVRTEGGWRISGQKIWTSLAQHAGWGICLARTDPDAPKHDGITYFLVDMSSPGIEVRPLKEITGEEIFNEVFLDDVFVPDDLVVGEVNGGWRVARNTLASERVALGDSWGPGSRYTDMMRLIEKLGGLAALRPAAVEEAGRLYAEGHSISLLDHRGTLRQLSGGKDTSTSSIRKLLGMRHSQRISEFCWSLGGDGGALGTGSYWSRMILVTRAFTIGGGTTEVQLNIIAERVLGLPRDP